MCVRQETRQVSYCLAIPGCRVTSKFPFHDCSLHVNNNLHSVKMWSEICLRTLPFPRNNLVSKKVAWWKLHALRNRIKISKGKYCYPSNIFRNTWIVENCFSLSQFISNCVVHLNQLHTNKNIWCNNIIIKYYQ